MHQLGNTTRRPGSLGIYVLGIMCLWTLLIVVSLVWDIHYVRKTTRELALKEARVHFHKDQAFRLWASSHGGVYVPEDERTPPNPYLAHLPERDIATPSGKKLTLMNPAYMLRQLQGDFEKLYEVSAHITSLKPLRPENAPDDWEASALHAFEEGAKEVHAFTSMEGEPYLRLMRPMVVEKKCLKCHGVQGYQEGDIRGGVSVSVPMAAYLSEEQGAMTQLVLTHALLWLTGLAGITMGYRTLKRRIDERLHIEQDLRQSREKHRLLVKSLPSIVYKGAADWSVEFFDDKVESLTGYKREDFNAGRIKWSEMIHEQDLESTKQSFVRALKGDLSFVREYRIITSKGATHWIQDRGQIVLDDYGKIDHISGVFFDITEHKAAAEALDRAHRAIQENSELLESIFANIHFLVAYMDSDFNFIRVNDAYARHGGYAPEFFVGKNHFDLYPHQENQAIFRRVVETGEPFFTFAKPFAYADQPERSITYWDWSLQPVKTAGGNVGGLVLSLVDVTERKRAEEKLITYQEQLRSLASELVLAEERERRSLATDLHDSIAQVLAIAKLKLDLLQSTASLPEDSETLQEIRQLIFEAIQQTRTLLFELSPASLYELGLEAALEGLARRMQEHHGILIQFLEDGRPKPLAGNFTVLLFRAVRELLLNTVKHSGAQNAWVSIYKEDKYVRIEVKDDGSGFDSSEIESFRDRFGLFSIRERLHHLGGRFEISSSPGRGTLVTMVAPLREEASPP